MTITPNRWQHILGVARQMTKFAQKIKPNNQKFAEDMFVLGVMHDIGYEFAGQNHEHAAIGGEILHRTGYKYWQEVALHGETQLSHMSDELFILNCADMTVDGSGQICTLNERLADISTRYGNNSDVVKTVKQMIALLQSDSRYIKIFD